jgi:transcriptional regulator of acetoin/glycerol metabolism
MTDPTRIAKARQVFFHQKGLPVDEVPHAILRSWIRCAEMGLNERSKPSSDALTVAELRHLHERHETLRRICRPELDALFTEARELSGIVILTNADGEILDAYGDASFADKAAQVALRPGAKWSENGTGTNAIGTALAERRAVVVNGAEHYFQDHRGLSCAATPIIDPRGTIIGVLDISTPAETQNAHLIGYVRLAIEQIEHRLFKSGFEGCQTLRFQTDPSLLGVAREGILVVKDDVVVGANRRGLSLIGQGWDGLDHLRLEDVFDATHRLTHSGIIHTHDGREFAFSMDDAHGHHDRPNSSAARLDEVALETIRKVVNQYGGNISKAARHLGIHRSTIYRRLEEKPH